MYHKKKLIFLFFISFFLCFPQITAWQTDGSPICTGNGSQGNLQICADGSEGAVISWSDNRTGAENDLYAQRVNSSGSTLWTTNGVVICNADNEQTGLQSCYDGVGGYIFVWQDKRDGIQYDIYAQKLSANGVPQWDANGTIVCSAAQHQIIPVIASDGQGNVYFAWFDRRQDGTTSDIYAQKLNSTGHPQWTLDGNAVCNLAGTNQEWPQIDCDSSGNLYVTWQDSRGASSDIYAQKLNSTGASQWTDNGTVICNDIYSQIQPIICADGLGGAIIAWTDLRTGTWKIYTQKIDSLGLNNLTANGVMLASAGAGEEAVPKICSDGAGGAIIVWRAERTVDYDIVGQRIDSTGVFKWNNSGLIICGYTANQQFHQICPDGAGGVIVTWEDLRVGSYKDIYAQKVSSNGTLEWTSTGEPVCVATGNQLLPVIACDGSGNAIIAWRDERTSAQDDIYAQRVPISAGNGIPGFALLYLTIGLLALIAIYYRKKLF